MSDTDASEDYIDDLVDFEDRVPSTRHAPQDQRYEPSESAPDTASYIDILDALSQRTGLTHSLPQVHAKSASKELTQTAEEARRARYEQWLDAKKSTEKAERARKAAVHEHKRAEKEKRTRITDDGKVEVFVPQMPDIPKAHQPVPVMVKTSKERENKTAGQKEFVRKMVKRETVRNKPLPFFWPLVPDVPKAAKSTTIPVLVRKLQKKTKLTKPAPKPSPHRMKVSLTASSSSSSRSDRLVVDEVPEQQTPSPITKRPTEIAKSERSIISLRTPLVRMPSQVSPMRSLHRSTRSVRAVTKVSSSSISNTKQSIDDNSVSDSASLVTSHNALPSMDMPGTAPYEGLWMSGGLIPGISAVRSEPESEANGSSSGVPEHHDSGTWVADGLPWGLEDQALAQKLPSSTFSLINCGSPRVRTLSTLSRSRVQGNRMSKSSSQIIGSGAAPSFVSIPSPEGQSCKRSAPAETMDSNISAQRLPTDESVTSHPLIKTRTPKTDSHEASKSGGVAGGAASPSKSHAASMTYYRPTVESVRSSDSRGTNTKHHTVTPSQEVSQVPGEAWAKYDDLDAAIDEWRKTSSNNVSPAEAKKLLKMLAGTSESSVRIVRSIASCEWETAEVPLPDSTPTSTSRDRSSSSITWHILQPDYPLTAGVAHKADKRSNTTGSSYNWHPMQARYLLSSSASTRPRTLSDQAIVDKGETWSEASRRLDEEEENRRGQKQRSWSCQKKKAVEKPHDWVVNGTRREALSPQSMEMKM